MPKSHDQFLKESLRDDLAHDISVIQEWAAKNPLVVKMWLFGSFARDEQHADSDLDIAVEHLVAPSDDTLETTALASVPDWCDELQPNLRLPLQLESTHEAVIVEDGLKCSSRLIYERTSSSQGGELYTAK
jgi:predicted nucleotidyltransferase